jgi:hypothetical protein
MDTLLDRLSSGQIVAVISILAGSVVAIAMIVAISKYQFQALADDTELRREKQHSDLSLREKLLERGTDRATIDEILALGINDAVPNEENTELAKRFGMLDASAKDIERTLAQALAAEPAQKKMIASVMDELIEYGSSSEVILAAIRPLCVPAAKPKDKKPLLAEEACA